MTVTFSSLQAKISKKLIDGGNTAIAVGDVQDAINDALHYWKQKSFWFNEAQVTLTMDNSAALDGSARSDPYVLGYGNSVANYPNAPVLPSNFLYEKQKDGFVIYYSSLRYRMKKISPAQLDGMSINGIGLPYAYCFRNGNYEFYFLPNLAYSLVVNYIKDYSDLVNPGDSNDFTNNADRLLYYEALARLYGENRQDSKMESTYQAKVEREYNLLRKRTGDNVASGELSIETII